MAARELPAQKPDRTRTERSDAEKAVEAVEVHERKLKRAQDRKVKARTELELADAELRPLQARLDYLLSDPALPKDELEKRKPKPVVAK